MSLNVALCHKMSQKCLIVDNSCRNCNKLWENYGKIVTKRHPTSHVKLLLAYCISGRPFIRLLIWMVNCYTLAVPGKIYLTLRNFPFRYNEIIH
jgi:hypothetical protein